MLSEIPRSLQENVNGFVVKGSPPQELLQALVRVLGEKPEKRTSMIDTVLSEGYQHAERARQHLRSLDECLSFIQTDGRGNRHASEAEQAKGQ